MEGAVALLAVVVHQESRGHVNLDRHVGLGVRFGRWTFGRGFACSGPDQLVVIFTIDGGCGNPNLQRIVARIAILSLVKKTPESLSTPAFLRTTKKQNWRGSPKPRCRSWLPRGW